MNTVSNVHGWEIARMAKTHAVRCTMEIEPQLITTRIKSSIKKQLRSGTITGGWRSESAKLALHLTEKFDLPVGRLTWQGLKVGGINFELKQELLQILQADWTAAVLESKSYATHSYYVARHERAQAILNDEASRGFHVSFISSDFAKQAAAAMTKRLSDNDKTKIEAALAALDSDQPIHLGTYH